MANKTPNSLPRFWFDFPDLVQTVLQLNEYARSAENEHDAGRNGRKPTLRLFSSLDQHLLQASCILRPNDAAEFFKNLGAGVITEPESGDTDKHCNKRSQGEDGIEGQSRSEA